MLLKCTADGRRIKVNGVPVNHGNVARGMKMTMSTSATMSARVHRKVIRAPHKRAHPGKTALSGKMVHAGKMAYHPGKLAHLGKFGKLGHFAHAHAIRPPEPCENSNDSGLGPDPVHRLTDSSEDWELETKRRRREESAVKLECDDANDAYTFPATLSAPATAHAPAQLPAPAPAPLATVNAALPVPVIRASCSISSPSLETGKRFQEPSFRNCGNISTGKLGSKYAGGGKLSGKLGGKLAGKLGGKYGGKLAQALARRRALAMTHTGPPGLAAPLSSRSKDGTVELQILCQPESQHRARYQTEGSRGAVKDNSGNGFPIVKLVGYDKPAVLQVFIGTDTGRVAPHMFYQACRVSGKNSTPCKERKEDGTVIIEIDLEPAKNWQVTCDCVGILKERNVDVEHRFGEALGGGAAVSRGKKKSTRCRMVFRTDIVNAEGHPETLQVCSTPIICTQPPGVPEVCRKSLVSCPATGGLELYLLGKNFLKETRVVFCQRQEGRTAWEEEVAPDKEFLQQTHLVCCVPPYIRTDITETVTVQLFVRSGGKASEPHTFFYTPPSLDAGPMHCTRHHAQGCGMEEARPVVVWNDAGTGSGAGMPGVGGMGPPLAPARRPSLILPDTSPMPLKAEAEDSSQHESDPSPASGSDSQDRPRMPDPLEVVDLRLKSEVTPPPVGFGYDSMKLSPSTPAPSESPSPLASFTQQLAAIQNQVQTDKMVETVTAAIFNTEDGGGASMYVDAPMLTMDQMRRHIPSKTDDMGALQPEMKALDRELLMNEATLQSTVQTVLQTTTERRLMSFDRIAPPPSQERPYDPYGAIAKMEIESTQMEAHIAERNAQMEALVEDAMKATAAMLPSDAAKLDELVNSRADDHLSGGSTSPSGASHASDVLLSPGAVVSRSAPELLPPMPASAISPDVILNPQVSPSMLCDSAQRCVMPGSGPTQEELMMMPELPNSVKTPPAAVKSMILNAAAEILTSDTTMNALVTSAINTANILSTEGSAQTDAQPQTEAPSEPLVAMSQAVSQAVTQAVSQAVTQAVSQAVSQEMTAPVHGLTDMSDQDLLSYINPSTFDQV